MPRRIGNIKVRTFKARHSLYRHGLNYDKQGAIYFTCKHYFTLLSEKEQERFRLLLWECCKHHEAHLNALFEYLTGELSVTELDEEYGICYLTLYRYLDEFYLNFEFVRRVY